MWIDTVLFTVTFIVSTALAVIGIMISYQLYQTHQKPVLQILLYQQIFLFSFFVYGIWGNIALHNILPDLSLNKELESKLTIFIPVLGIPFLLVSWFMLIRFSFKMKSIKELKLFPYAYFPTLFVIFSVLSIMVSNGTIRISEAPELFIIRAITGFNLFIHFIFIAPFLIKKIKPMQKETGFQDKFAFLYFTGVVVYSGVSWFFNIIAPISTCISILILFAISILIPVFLKLNEKSHLIPQSSTDLSFNDFCKLYEISKREAEIVQEICTGKSNKDISEKLFISLQTVKDHNYRIYSKLGIKTRGQLTKLVREKTGI